MLTAVVNCKFRIKEAKCILWASLICSLLSTFSDSLSCQKIEAKIFAIFFNTDGSTQSFTIFLMDIALEMPS